jgi:CBS domain containing-hemolysin-like protein
MPNASKCGDDAPLNNKNRSFSPFVKVVEPIKRQMSQQSASTRDEEQFTVATESSTDEPVSESTEQGKISF